MSESTDEAQLSTTEEVASPAAEARASTPSSHDADDVEVLAHPPEETPSASRHDSVVPTSRKLAPPPKPKRDSSNPGSVPAPPADSAAAALVAGESLRAISEALAQEGLASSKGEIAGSRPPVPRPRSQPSINPAATATALEQGSSGLAEMRPVEAVRGRDKLPTVPDSSSIASRKSASVSPQRIIAIGKSPSAAAQPAPAPASAAPATLQSLESSPVAEHVVTAEPPPVVTVPRGSFPPVAPRPEVPPAPLESAAPVVPELPPPPALPSTVVAPVATAALPVVAEPAQLDVPVSVDIASEPRVAAAPVVEATEGPDLSVDVHVDEAPHDIPITTDFDEDTPTLPQSLPPERSELPAPLAALLEPSQPAAAPPPPVEAPPLVSASPELVAKAEPPAPTEVAPDSGDRVQVEELSREDSPSVPPEAPTPAPPPAPSARAEGKPPPPPKRAPAPPPAELASSEIERKKAKTKRPWWEELFSEDFVRANWKVSDEQIKREVTFVEESLGVAPGGVVLDLGCGSGQHAVELASRGYGVVGYDLSLYQLALAADNAQERSQKLNFLQGDMREMAFEEMFDGIFCWNTTFGYFEEDKNFSVAERAFRALRPGGMLLVDVMNRDFVAAHTPSSVWFEGDSCVCMDDAVIDYYTSRLRVKRSVILDDGRTRECTYSVRLYSFHELGKLLHEVGFRVTEVSGHPATPGVFLGQASPRILMLAQRP
ncbi:MAG TPA: methyltransferase domain-containing protein [Polyangiaceae bacterium]|nr:methyltransferase domain-containing protein [Polyangiaceae bacterium]